MNITWLYPAYLLLIPLLFALFLVRRRHHVRSRVARPKVKHLLASPTGVSKSVDPGATAKRSGGWLGLIALCFACTALARPQWGEIEQRTYERSREVIIALDLSRSMLGTDVPPNRLDRAKLLVDSLVNELEGERVGLVVFAGTSFVQYPLSNDYEVLREMLKEVNPTFLPQQGTDFGKLLQTAYKAFDFSSSSDRFLIVLSDGEDLAGDWETELKKYVDAKIHIIALGVGTTAGSVLPETGGGVIKDEKGAVVLSRLDSKILQKLADETTGRYIDAYRWVDLAKVISETVDLGEKGEFAKKQQILKVERFQIPLGIALLFAFLSLWRDFPVYPRQTIRKPSQLEKSLDRHARKKSPTPAAPVIALLFFLTLLPLSAQPAAPQGVPPEPKPGDKLAGAVQSLSSRENLIAPDYAQFAEETIGYGKAQQQAKAEIAMGAIDDALLGVDEGEAMDAKAADWPKLRKELEELKKKSSDQQEQKKDQQKQDKKDQDQNKDKDQKQDQQKQDSGGSGDKDKPENKPDQQSGKDQQKQDQKDQQSQNQDQQKQDAKDQQSGQSGGDQQKPSPQGGQDQKPEQPKDPKEQKPDEGKGQDPKEKEKDSKNQPQPSPGEGQEQKEKPAETKQVGGGGQKEEKEKEGENAEMLRKLDQIKQKDSPGKIYQLFSPQEPSKEIKGKTW